MKEVIYLHAEGMPAGFLKHGTLSLIDHNTPRRLLMPPKEQSGLYDLMLSSMEEVHACGGRVIAFGSDDVPGHVDGRSPFAEDIAVDSPISSSASRAVAGI